MRKGGTTNDWVTGWPSGRAFSNTRPNPLISVGELVLVSRCTFHCNMICIPKLVGKKTLSCTTEARLFLQGGQVTAQTQVLPLKLVGKERGPRAVDTQVCKPPPQQSKVNYPFPNTCPLFYVYPLQHLLSVSLQLWRRQAA